MKVAFLILAHHQPEHLARLVNNLKSDWNDIYIHIDRTSDLDSFIAYMDMDDSLIFLEGDQRIDYTWCGFSSVEAILSLLSAAFDSGQPYDRFCLLTGADFPIKSIDEIKTAFSKKTEFMRIDRQLGTEKSASYSRIVNYYHFVDQKDSKGTPPSGVIEREIYGDIDLYHGSTWWALSYECIGYIIDYLQNHPQYIEFHKYTFCPDEVFFHSIVKSSPYAEKLKHDFERESDLEKYKLLNEHGCHYIDWNSKEEYLPKILDLNDSSHIIKSDALFARKMDVNRSSSLIDKIEEITGNGTSNHQKDRRWAEHGSDDEVLTQEPATQAMEEIEKKYIFILSHMRSYSSLLCHILGSNKDVSGYAESNLSYENFADLSMLHESIIPMTGEQRLSKNILDKLLHNYWHVPDVMLGSRQFKFIFLLREPKDTLQSIIFMTNGFSSVINDKAKVEGAVNYYLSRLNELMNMARKCRANVMFVNSEDIICKTDAILNNLTSWLGLAEPLTNEYDMFSHTGRPNYGDPSRYIKTGKICHERRENKDIVIPKMLLEKCKKKYRECSKVLKNCEIR